MVKQRQTPMVILSDSCSRINILYLNKYYTLKLLLENRFSMLYGLYNHLNTLKDLYHAKTQVYSFITMIILNLIFLTETIFKTFLYLLNYNMLYCILYLLATYVVIHLAIWIRHIVQRNICSCRCRKKGAG